MAYQVIEHGSAIGVMVENAVHILMHPHFSVSRFHLAYGPEVGRYCCQGGCCSGHPANEVEAVILRAKELGATTVVLRRTPERCRVASIAGLAVEDVSDYVGDLEDDCRVFILDRE